VSNVATTSKQANKAASKQRESHLCVLELLLNIANHRVAGGAHKGAKPQLRPDFRAPGDGATDGQQLPNFGGLELTDPFWLRDKKRRANAKNSSNSHLISRNQHKWWCLLVNGGQAVNTDPELTQVLLSQSSISWLPLPHNILQTLPQMCLVPAHGFACVQFCSARIKLRERQDL